MDTPSPSDKPFLPQETKKPGVLAEDMEMLMHVISHDLRTPIATIQGFCQELTMACDRLKTLFEEEAISDEMKEHLNPFVTQDLPEAVRCIRAGADSVNSVTSGIFRLIQLGQWDIQWERLDVNQLVMDIVTCLEFQLKKKGMVLHIADLPDCMGDKVLVTKVFANLIDNAQKFLEPSRPGEIHVFGKMVDGWSVYAITDNGIGISPEQQAQLFQGFPRPTAQHGKEQSLGLAIVRRIVDRHQGKIEIESVPGSSTTVQVYFPRAVNVEVGGSGSS